MSASNKKKLRKAENEAALTERQQHERKESTKLKIYTAIAMVVLVLMIGYFLYSTISGSGFVARHSTALKVNDHKISAAEMNYFYVDSINNVMNQMSQYGDYGPMIFGLDTSKPLDQQVTNKETGATWADDMIAQAQEAAKEIYAVYDAAVAAGYKLPQSEIDAIDASITSMQTYSVLYGFADGESYLKAMYGTPSTFSTYREYCIVNSTAKAYYNAYNDALTYDAAALQARNDENPVEFNSYSFHVYPMNVSSFYKGGTTDENGTVTYSDDDKALGAKEAAAMAERLQKAGINSVDALDEAIAALSYNEGKDVHSTANTGILYANMANSYKDWVADTARQPGDFTVVENKNSSDEITSYSLVLFDGCDDNASTNLINVRHILIGFSDTSKVTDEEKQAAKEKAETILQMIKDNGGTEEAFTALVAENSTDGGSSSNGGLYENVYPGQMVPEFNDWCFDEARQVGDMDIVETTYGYHIMFFSGKSESSYRDFMIENVLRNTDMDSWYTGVIENATMTVGTTKYLKRDIILSSK